MKTKVYENRDQNKLIYPGLLKEILVDWKILYLKIFEPFTAYIYVFLKVVYEFLRSLIFMLLIPISIKKHSLISFQYIIRATSTFLSLFNFKYQEYKN